MKLKIEKLDHQGSGIGKIDKKIIFVPKTIPNDIVEIEIIKDKKNYSLGICKRIIEKSDNRTLAKCPYYEICGGCHISHLSYELQLQYKLEKVKEIFKKYLNIDINPDIIQSPKIYNYRNKITYHVTKDNKLGLISIKNKPFEINNCLLTSDKINNLFKKITVKDLSKLKSLTIRECQNGLILIFDGELDYDDLKTSCIGIYKQNKCLYEKEKGYIKINNLKYQISSSSFFQINTSNIKNLYDIILQYGSFSKNDRVIDLYCGVGSISLYVAKYVKSVQGIEIIEKAITSAKENAKLNNITNTKFICGDVSKLINSYLEADIIILDPPRTGLDKNTQNIINSSQIKKIIYVSCNPITLVRDIKSLNNYSLLKITLVDMFPQTHHVECVSLLHRKNLEK